MESKWGFYVFFFLVAIVHLVYYMILWGEGGGVQIKKVISSKSRIREFKQKQTQQCGKY